MRHLIAGAVLGLVLVACSTSGRSDGSDPAAGASRPNEEISSPSDATATPATTLPAPDCDDGEGSLSVRLSGPDLFEFGSQSVLEVSTPDGRRCGQVVADVAWYDADVDRLTSEAMLVRIPMGTFDLAVWQRECDRAGGCGPAIGEAEGAPPGSTDSADSAPSRSPACELTVSIDTDRPLDIVTEYDEAGCVDVRHVDGDGGADGPVVYAQPAREGEDTLGTGTLELIDDCLWLADDGGEVDSFPMIIWQAGTHWDPDRREVVLPDGRRLAPGDRVSARGGFHPVDGLGSFGADVQIEQKVVECVGVRDDPLDRVFVIQHPLER